jgi:hypothetical protein
LIRIANWLRVVYQELFIGDTDPNRPVEVAMTAMDSLHSLCEH